MTSYATFDLPITDAQLAEARILVTDTDRAFKPKPTSYGLD